MVTDPVVQFYIKAKEELDFADAHLAAIPWYRVFKRIDANRKVNRALDRMVWAHNRILEDKCRMGYGL